MQPATLRPFQDAVVARARDANVVMVGSTGIGKTFVAIALLSEQDYSGGKRAFVLAPTRQLVWQIAAKIASATTLRAGAFCGRAVEQWGQREWARELVLTRVVVCTPEVLRNALERGLVRMTQINLLVFDECHHVTKRHPYAHVIKMYDVNQRESMPRVFGTTACPTRDCARNLHAEIFKVELLDHETVAYAAVAPILLEEYTPDASLPLETMQPLGLPLPLEEEEETTEENLLEQVITNELLASGLRPLVEILTELNATVVLRKLLRKGKLEIARDDTRCNKLVRKFVLSCVEIFKHFGVWCVYRFIELEIERAAVNASLLINVPGSMFGYDSAAQRLLLLAQTKRITCEFAATTRLHKVAELLQERLLEGDASSASQQGDDDDEDDEEEEEDDEEQDDFDDLDSCAATAETDHSSSSRGFSGQRTDREAMETSQQDQRKPRRLQGIIFVTTRAECRVVCDYLNERLGETATEDRDDNDSTEDDASEADDSDDGSISNEPLFACILGQASSRDTASFGLPKMEEILSKFEKGQLQCLVSTAVSIEGVDFPQCSLIIVAGRIQSARKLMQLRGRARHEDGVVYYLCERGDREHAMHFKAMEQEAASIDALDFRHDKLESVFAQPRSQAAVTLAGFEFFPEESRICVGATGAVLDLDSSIARLNMFCQTLPKQMVMDAGDLKHMYTFEPVTVSKRLLFRATLQLPAALELPVFASDLLHSKSTAKAAVAFKACKYLFENGLLDASLNSVYRKPKVGDLGFLFERLNH